MRRRQQLARQSEIAHALLESVHRPHRALAQFAGVRRLTVLGSRAISCSSGAAAATSGLTPIATASAPSPTRDGAAGSTTGAAASAPR